ncbi:MAG: hypothetical protein V9F04_07685 [Dermatophilaceae bacterium]
MLACLLATASLVLLAACQSAPNANLTPDDVKAKALDHLKAKYGRTFKLGAITWGEPWGDRIGLGGKHTVIDAYPEGGDPTMPFLVKVDPEAVPIAFHDYYVVQLVAPEYEKRAVAAASTVFPGSLSAVYGPGTRGIAPPDSFDANTTFEQFKAWADTGDTIEFCTVFPVAAGQTKEKVQEKVPALVAALSTVARRGSIVVTGYDPDVFTTKVLPAWTDDSLRAECGSGRAAFHITQYW